MQEEIRGAPLLHGLIENLLIHLLKLLLKIKKKKGTIKKSYKPMFLSPPQ